MKQFVRVLVCSMFAFCLVGLLPADAFAASAKTPAKAVISSVKSTAVSKVTVKVKKAKNAKGYQYRVALNKACTKKAKTKQSAKTMVTFTCLKAGAKYYVKVRAYNKVGKKTKWGKWSAVKTVTVKKKKAAASSASTPAASSSMASTATPTASTSANTHPVATVTVKGYGSFSIILYPEYAPKTVANFRTLANGGFYDGLTFHRVVEGFVLQGGDPAANGTGGSGTAITGEFHANGNTSNLLAIAFGRGTVAMARAGNDFNSATSQFFITLESSASVQASLNGLYAAFGLIGAADMQTVDKIVAATKTAPKDAEGTGTITSKASQPVIERIRVSG